MRRGLLLVVTTGLLAAVVAALASAQPTTTARHANAARTTKAENAISGYLPTGVTQAAKNWLSPEGDESNTRFSSLSQINANNVQNLHVDWNAQFNDPTIQFTPEGQPICCANNMMYLAYQTGVVALNPGTGATLWNYQGTYTPPLAGQRVHVDEPRTTSYSTKQNEVYSGQQDGSIVALNATTGAPVWTAQVTGAGGYGPVTGAESAPYTKYYDDGADGVILSAPNGGESPFRGHLDAYDAKTGKLDWRAWTLPDPTQIPFIYSWGNPAEAATGGGADWSVPAVSPQLHDVYFGTGNPFPETTRAPGNDLWTESIMAVDWKTGALNWFYQTTHHDEFDFDDPHPPMVMNVPINGKMVQVVAEGSKSGLFFVLNARNGGAVPNFKIVNTPVTDPGNGQGIVQNDLTSTQPIPQGAADCMVINDYSPAGLARCGFPANTVATEYGGANNINIAANGSVVNAADNWPINGSMTSGGFYYGTYSVWGGAGGGGNFGYPPSTYDPLTKTYYGCLENESGGHSDLNPTGNFTKSVSASSIQGITGFMSAINMTNDTMLWQYQSQATGLGVCYSGDMATAGNLVFTAFKGRSDVAATLASQGNTQQGAGSDLTPGGQIDAFNATTGSIVWTWGIPFDTFGAPPITYEYQGKQYFAIYHGTALAGTPGATPSGQRDQLTVFSL